MTKRNLSELIVKQIPIENVQGYENNPRKNDKAVNAVAVSIEKYGFKQPCVVDEDNILIVGHTRYKAALQLGLKTIPCVVATDLTPEEVREYRIMDNKLNELAEWDFEKLGEELADMPDFDFEAFGFTTEDFLGKTKSTESIYNQKIKGPIYEPQGPCPKVSSVYDLKKFQSLSESIEKSDVPEEIKTFLRFAAHRHIVFDYQAIAEFYAHAEPEVQELMEDSALVIIDF